MKAALTPSGSAARAARAPEGSKLVSTVGPNYVPTSDRLEELIVVPSHAAVADAVAAGLPDADQMATRRAKFLAIGLADDECDHGRLAGDRTPPCGCWPTERMADVVPMPLPDTAPRRRRRAA